MLRHGIAHRHTDTRTESGLAPWHWSQLPKGTPFPSPFPSFLPLAGQQDFPNMPEHTGNKPTLYYSLLTATFIFCCMSKCKASFEPPIPPGATSTAAMTAETYAVTAALQDHKQDGQELTEVGPHSALYTAVTIDNLLQKDPLNQQFTPGIAPPSAAPIQVWPGNSTDREEDRHTDAASSPLKYCAGCQCRLVSKKGEKKINQFLLYRGSLFADLFRWYWKFISFTIL